MWLKNIYSEKIFQLTTSRGGRLLAGRTTAGKLVFQLTTSRGGRHMQQFEEAEQKIFNSRPLVEVDQSVRYIMWRLGRFQLTTSRGGRPSCRVHLYLLSFSTHDLSWRSTIVENYCVMMAIFQLTTSRGGRQQNFTINH